MKDTDVENEIINLQASLVLQAHKNDPDMWKLVESPCLRKVALKMKALFGSTYLCESSFSDMNWSSQNWEPNLLTLIWKIVWELQCRTTHHVFLFWLMASVKHLTERVTVSSWYLRFTCRMDLWLELIKLDFSTGVLCVEKFFLLSAWSIAHYLSSVAYICACECYNTVENITNTV